MNSIPAIRRLFPDARIILALRHPCDVVLSCYVTNFKPNNAMASFLSLETAAELYDLSFALFEKSRELLKPALHVNRYEKLVDDRDRELRPLLDFLELDWDERVLDHESTARARGHIKTASYAQVVEPIYKRSAGRWENYRKHLEPVLPDPGAMGGEVRLRPVKLMDTASISLEADRAAAAGDLQRAIALLQEAAERGEESPALWLKIAAMQRMRGKLRAPRSTSVHRALALAPLDFTALLMRASLLQRLGEQAAGEAWGHALAQRPDGELPPQLASVLAEAEQHHAAWLAEREMRMRAAMSGAEKHANAEERQRIERFRSNALRRTRVYHSEPTHFHFPELREREFHPRSALPWLERTRGRERSDRPRARAVMAAERAELVPYIQYEEHQPLDQWRELNRNPRLDRNPFDQERRPGRSECTALSANDGAARATAAAARFRAPARTRCSPCSPPTPTSRLMSE